MASASLTVALTGLLATQHLTFANESQGRDGRDQSECRVQDDSGRWVSCDDLLNTDQAPADSKPSRQKSNGRLPNAAPLNEVQYGEQQLETVNGDKQRSAFKDPSEVSSFREMENPWYEIKDKPKAHDSILKGLRSEIAMLEQKYSPSEREIKKGRLTDGERDYVRKKAILEKIEIIGLRLRQHCAASRGLLDEVPSVGIPHDGSVTMAHPFIVIHMKLEKDPMGCERDLLIEESLYQKVRRYVEIEEVLNDRTRRFRQGRAEKRRLKKEKKQIEQELWSASPIWEYGKIEDIQGVPAMQPLVIPRP